MDNKLTYVGKLLRKWFLPPAKLDWGYPVLLLSIATALCYGARCMFQISGWGWSTTSIAGYALMISVLTLFALIIPAVLLVRNYQDRVVGSYTGIAPLILAFFSGVPVMLLSTSVHNYVIMAWTSLRLDMVFPVYFYRTELTGTPILLYQILVDTIIPAFGIVIFFCGLWWSSFKAPDKTTSYFIIGLFYAIFWLNLFDFLSLLITGCWLAFLRTKTRNIWGPFVCLIGTRITEIFFGSTLKSIELTSIQTYSDIEPTYFYASIPSILIGSVLLFFFMKMLNDFYNSYSVSIHGDIALDKEVDDDDTNKANFAAGINPAFFVGVIILAVVWILVYKGAHL